jgi:hypothetical protein
VRNNRFARDELSAKDQLRAAEEWIRSIRDQLGWDGFYSSLNSDSSPVTFCLDTLPQTTADFQALGNSPCTIFQVITINGTTFTRTMVLTLDSTTQVTSVTTMAWTDGNKQHQVNSTLILHQWQ